MGIGHPIRLSKRDAVIHRSTFLICLLLTSCLSWTLRTESSVLSGALSSIILELSFTNMAQIKLHVTTSWSDQRYTGITAQVPTETFPGPWNIGGRVLTCLRGSYAGRIGQVRH